MSQNGFRIKQEQLIFKPDHGENFVPGSESAPDHMSPQPLDHFRRGYKERSNLRDREETDFPANASEDFSSQPPVKTEPQSDPNGVDDGPMTATSTAAPPTTTLTQPPPPIETRQQQHMQPPIQRKQECRGNFRSAFGFDSIRLVDVLCRPGCDLEKTLDRAKVDFPTNFQSGKALTAILSNLARRRNMGIALFVWQWMDSRGMDKNVYHYNSLISVCEKMKDNKRALRLLTEMEGRGIPKNEVTFSSAISACEKAGQWRVALELLDSMKREGVGRTAIAYNAAISACEKGLVPHKALELFDQMKREGVVPTVVTYSALISAAEKGQQWKLALEVLDEMKASGHGANVIAYSAAISALSKGQMWEKALELFREIERSGNTPSIVTYNATMTALEKGLQWERALDLFDEMKAKHLPITVVSYGSAISACEKGLQYRQCLEYLDEMTELGIKKNVIIFGAAMSCMEKCCRADIAFQLMDRMKFEGVAPNVHIFNSAISACARCNLWSKGLELFEEMEKVGVGHDVVSFNAVLDAVSTQIPLGRRLFELGIEKGFYARVSRLGTHWLELDLHFLSLGGGEIALGWWFEECLVPYLVNTSKLAAIKSIDIVTGYGKTRMRGVRHGDDGMRKRVRAMLDFMGIGEIDQPNKGRIHVDKEALIQEVQKNGGKILFDHDGYNRFKEQNTTANHTPDVIQNVRPRYSGPIHAAASMDRHTPANRLEGNDRRASVVDPRRDGSTVRSSRPESNIDASPSFTRRDGRFNQEDGNEHGSYKRRGSYSERSKSGNNLYYDSKLHYRESSHGNNPTSRSDEINKGPDYDDSHSDTWQHGPSHRRLHEGSRDQHFGGRRGDHQKHQEQGMNERDSTINNKGSDTPSNFGGGFQRKQRGLINSREDYQNNHAGALPAHRWEAPNKKVGDWRRPADRALEQPAHQSRYQATHRSRNEEGQSDRAYGAKALHGNKVREGPRTDFVQTGGETLNTGDFDGGTRKAPRYSREDENGWRQSDHVDDGFSRSNARNDLSERWRGPPNDAYLERRSIQTPSNLYTRDDNRLGDELSNANASRNNEAEEFHNRSDDAGDHRSTHAGHGDHRNSNLQGDRRDPLVGDKRSLDNGERPAAKRRGYDVDSSRSSFSNSRGY